MKGSVPCQLRLVLSAFLPIAITNATPAGCGKEIQVLSDPTGARIEVNNEDEGVAPLNVKVPEVNGIFSGTTVIRALPTVDGDETQWKIFEDGQAVPSRILFQMNLVHITPAIDLNVHQSD